MTDAREWVLGTRGSTLARAQSEQVAALLAERGHRVRLEILVTRGDRDRSRPVPELGGKGVFTAELEDALRSGAIDFAVHSLKDLPTEDPPGLIVAAVPPRAEARDALVAGVAGGLADLPHGARVGTASLRRRALLLARRPDLAVEPLRGNVDTRLARVADGALDAVVVAAAGLARLGRTGAITALLGAPDGFLPAPAQGALALQARADADGAAARTMLADLHDAATARCVAAERALLRELEGGCSVPVGAWARAADAAGALALDGVVASPDGTRVLRASGRGDDAVALGVEVATRLRESGAQEILDDVRG